MKILWKRLRLLPAVMILGAALLAVKGAGLMFEARAQEHEDRVETSTATTAPQSADPAAEDSESSSARIDVLSSLAKRRAALDGRERDLDMRANLIAAAEKRVDGKIDDLKQLQSEMQTLLMQRDAAEQKQLDAIVKTYASMRPKDAARIFDNLNDEVELAVASQLKPDVLAQILAGMQPEAAQKLTLKLANRLKLPEKPAIPSQVAQVQPAPAAPAAPQQTSAPQAANPPAESEPSPAPAAPPASGK